MQDHLTKRSFHYFDHPLKHKFWSLIKHRTLFFIATGLIGLFLPIYLYTEGGFTINQITILYGSASLVYVLLLPYMGQVINKLHIQKSMMGAVIFFSLYLATLAYGVPYDISLVILAFLFLTGFRFLYFTPYITEFSSQTEGGQSTRQVGVVMISKMVTSIFAPLLAGFIVTYYSYNVLYGFAIFFMLLSIAPLASLGDEKHIKFDWDAPTVWKNYGKYLKTKSAYAYIALGMETFIILFIWPLVLYEILDGDILLVGLVATLISIIMIIVQATTAKLMDTKVSRSRSAFIMTPLSALGWVGKVFISSTGGLVLVSIYHDFTRMFFIGSVSSMEQDTFRESKEYMDEIISIREMYIHTGRVIAAILVVFLLSAFGVQTTLWIAVIGSLIQVGFLKKDMVVRGKVTDMKETVPEEVTVAMEEVVEEIVQKKEYQPGEEVR